MRHRYFPPTKAIATDEGMATKNLKGSSWWAKRWIATLEGFLDPRRLARGKTYARKGQVLELELGPLEAVASVQGSRRTPYTVRMATKPLSEKQWRHVTELLASRALYVAQLLAGEVPPEIEDLFAEAGAALLPRSRKDLKISCSCPDGADVCKHAAAVAYLLGESFDHDPFGLFLLRGRSREELLASLGSSGLASVGSSGSEPKADKASAASSAEEASTAPAAEEASAAPTADKASTAPEPEGSFSTPLPTDLAGFWTGGELPPVAPPTTPAVQMQLLHRLGPLAGESLVKLLGRQYRQMSAEAVALWAGEEGFGATDDDD